MLPNFVNRATENDWARALASLISFQERYDLSVRLEWDPLLGQDGRWVIKANSLADLTKRENRYEHHGFVPMPDPTPQQDVSFTGNPLPIGRHFPFAVASSGVYENANQRLRFVFDPQLTGPPQTADFDPLLIGVSANNNLVVNYETTQTRNEIVARERQYPTRPFVYVDGPSDRPATARAVTDEKGNVVHVTRGLAPLGGTRRGEDVILTNALAFDLRVYDPGAPVYAYFPGADAAERADRVVEPSDPAWPIALAQDLSQNVDSTIKDIGNAIADNEARPFAFERFGAYVDLGYGQTFMLTTGGEKGQLSNRFFPVPLYVRTETQEDPLTPLNVSGQKPRQPSFFHPGALWNTLRNPLAPGYSVLMIRGVGVTRTMESMRIAMDFSMNRPMVSIAWVPISIRPQAPWTEQSSPWVRTT